MAWSGQVDEVCKKLNKCYYVILNLRKTLDVEAMMNIYYAFAYSAISYGIVAWGRSVDVHRVFVLQKRLIRLMFGLPHRESCREHFKTNRILTVCSVYLYRIITYIFNRKSEFPAVATGHFTRHGDVLRPRRARHAFQEKAPLNAGCRLFNKLPPIIKNETCLKKFKYLLKEYLINGCFYTVSEFVEPICDIVM